jgi:hypothetical protein
MTRLVDSPNTRPPDFMPRHLMAGGLAVVILVVAVVLDDETKAETSTWIVGDTPAEAVAAWSKKYPQRAERLLRTQTITAGRLRAPRDGSIPRPDDQPRIEGYRQQS